MKTILIIALILIGMIGLGQGARLDSVYVSEPNGNVDMIYSYVYNEEDELTKIYRWDEESIIDGVYSFWDDTLRKYEGSFKIILYYDYQDTLITVTEEYGGYFYYHLNDQGYATKITYSYIEEYYDFTWEGDNVVEIYWDGSLEYELTYYDDYINPFYMQWLGFKNPFYEFASSSYNFHDALYNTNGTTKEYVIDESIGQYPTVVSFYIDDIFKGKYQFVYHDEITGTREIPSSPYKVLSVDYYDMMGRKISKPKQGFYIERKVTDKGIISTKHYLQ